jgi:RNA polymerase sigma-70 factor, ECF subfamily
MTPEPGNFPASAESNREQGSGFEALMRAHGPRIYTLAVRLSGNIADGQDLAQETFLQAHKNFHKFRGEAAFGTWVYRICVNLWKNRVRYEKRRAFWKHISLWSRGDEDDPAPLEIPGDDPAPGAVLEGEESRAAVRDALDRLDPQDRTILVLRDMEDKSYEEIAALLGVPLGTVKSRLARGRVRLRDILKTKGLASP